MLNNTKSFKCLNKLKCFFYTSDIDNNNTDIVICNANDNNNKYILICFSIGITKYYDTTKSLLYYISKVKTDENSNTNIYNPQFYELIILLSQIKYYLEDNTYKNIILCGHSRGITVATYCSYILLILSSDDDMISKLPKHHNGKEFINALKEYILDSNTQEIILNKQLLEYKIAKNKIMINKVSYDNLVIKLEELKKFNIICSKILNLKLIKKQIQNKIYICGTGGYPILWTKLYEFNIFNKFYLNKYIHLIAGNKENNIQIYDKLTYYNKYIYIINNIEYIQYQSKKTNADKHLEIDKFKNIKNINYVYKNFGSIIFNLINNSTIKCYKIDAILHELQKYDKTDTYKNINYNINLDTNTNINTDTYPNTNTNNYLIYHRFEFYRYLFNKYMKFL